MIHSVSKHHSGLLVTDARAIDGIHYSQCRLRDFDGISRGDRETVGSGVFETACLARGVSFISSGVILEAMP